MPNADNHTHNNYTPPNGKAEEVPPLTIQQQFTLEDFSQRAINNGQQRINYEFTVAGKELSEALALLTDLLVAKGLCTEADLVNVNQAIAEATTVVNTVADIFPPGCPSNPPDKGQGTATPPQQ